MEPVPKSPLIVKDLTAKSEARAEGIPNVPLPSGTEGEKAALEGSYKLYKKSRVFIFASYSVISGDDCTIFGDKNINLGDRNTYIGLENCIACGSDNVVNKELIKSALPRNNPTAKENLLSVIQSKLFKNSEMIRSNFEQMLGILNRLSSQTNSRPAILSSRPMFPMPIDLSQNPPELPIAIPQNIVDANVPVDSIPPTNGGQKIALSTEADIPELKKLKIDFAYELKRQIDQAPPMIQPKEKKLKVDRVMEGAASPEVEWPLSPYARMQQLRDAQIKMRRQVQSKLQMQHKERQEIQSKLQAQLQERRDTESKLQAQPPIFAKVDTGANVMPPAFYRAFVASKEVPLQMEEKPKFHKPMPKKQSVIVEDSDQKLCIICEQKEIITVNMPCGHALVCNECAIEYVEDRLEVSTEVLCPKCDMILTGIHDLFI